MSRNLDVLEQLQEDRDLFRVPQVASRGAANGKRCVGKAGRTGTDTLAREELIGLAQRLFLGAPDGSGARRPRKVVFCGVDHFDTSALCAQLGRILASHVASGVCVVDANVRARSLESLMKTEASDAQHSQQTGAPVDDTQQIASNLWMVSAHAAAQNGGVSALLNRVSSQIKDLHNEFTYVVISAPPASLCSDAVLLGQIADGVVLVLEANSTRRLAARKAKQALEAANVPVLGTVLNNRTFPIPEKIYRWL